MDIESNDGRLETTICCHEISKAESKPASLFNKLVGMIVGTFKAPKGESPQSLGKRVKEHEGERAEKVHGHFLAVVQRLEASADDELVEHIQAAIEIINRDFRRVQKKLTAVPDEETAKSYQLWLEKAKRWIDLDSQSHDRAAIVDTIMKQLSLDLSHRIDQDLQVIFGYENRILDDLAVSIDEREKLEQVILMQLLPHTQALIKLKEPPSELDMGNVAEWKKEIDLLRQHHFDKALHAIDVIIDDFSPYDAAIEAPHDMQCEMAQEVMELVSSASILTLEAQKLPTLDEKERKNFVTSYLLMQKQLHTLNGNLNLSQDLFERLQGVHEQLAKIELSLGDLP